MNFKPEQKVVVSNAAPYQRNRVGYVAFEGTSKGIIILYALPQNERKSHNGVEVMAVAEEYIIPVLMN